MFSVIKEITFDAAHCLEGYIDPTTNKPSKCASLHGHTYKVQVVVHGHTLDKYGILVDFSVLGHLLDGVKSQLDHTYLNENVFLLSINTGTPFVTTAENLALLLWGYIAKGLLNFLETTSFLDRLAVGVSETPKSCAWYEGALK